MCIDYGQNRLLLGIYILLLNVLFGCSCLIVCCCFVCLYMFVFVFVCLLLLICFGGMAVL